MLVFIFYPLTILMTVYFFQVRLVPLEMPGTICSCSQRLSVITGKPIAVVTMNGKENFGDGCHFRLSDNF